MTAPTGLVTGVDFVTLPSTDFATAVEFYGAVFGLEFQPHTHPIALHVEDLHAARAELEAHGVAFPADTLDSGVCHMAHFADPDGNALMFHHRYAPRAS